MQAVFDHSWRFLTEDERATMRRFAVFWGGCTRDAAAQVTGASLKALAGLVVKSMLRYDPARGRYDVQDLLHQYAHEQLLAAGDSDAVHDAHCGYYVDFMRERGDDIKGRRQLAGLNEIEVDFNNVRVAWEYAVGHADYDAPDGMMECLVLFCEWKRSFLRENTALPSTSDTSLSIIALTFHSDGNIYGAHPGDSGLNSHVHIFAPIPPM